MKQVLGLATVAALLACAAPAQAAPVVDVGRGEAPDIAVDSAGVAHITRDLSGSGPEAALYCQIARGGSACANEESFAPNAEGDPDFIFGRVHVFLSPPTSDVWVFQERCCDAPSPLDKTYVHRSADGGATFGAPTRVGSFASGNADEAVLGPGATITAITETVTAGVFVQNAPLSGPQVDSQAQLHGSISAEGAIGLDPADSRPVAVFIDQSDGAHEIYSRHYTGPIDTASINNAANWGPPQLVSSSDQLPNGPALAGGPTGLFLFYELPSPTGDRGMVARFDGTRFGPPVQVTETASLTDLDITQDAGGRLHAVWNGNYDDDPLRYAISDNGVNWSPPTTLHRGEDHFAVRVSAAPDHQGFAVWSNASGEGAVRAVPLEPLPDTASPVISGFGMDDKTLRPGEATKFTFESSEAGSADLVIEKKARGLKLKKAGKLTCLPQTKKRLNKLRRQLARKASVKRLAGKARKRRLAKLLKKRRCAVWRRIGSIRQAVIQGRNEIVFSGRIAGRKLRPGSYRARLTVTDAAGNVSAARTVKFRVIRRKRP